jgi:elongation factor 1 alpha-like protein
MQRVKNIDYDEDDFYPDDEEAEEEGGYTDEDRHNFVTLTPVVRAELDEAGLQASDREIEEALWHYYWDVGKSVAYLKNSRTPRTQQQGGKQKKGEGKAKSKFDQAAERNSKSAGEYIVCSLCLLGSDELGMLGGYVNRRGGSLYLLKH